MMEVAGGAQLLEAVMDVANSHREAGDFLCSCAF